MTYEEIADIFALLPGASDSPGKSYTWTSKPMEIRDTKYPFEQISWSVDPDGYILIDALTGQPFDIKAFIADIMG